MLEHAGTLAGVSKAVGPAISASRLVLRKLRLFGTFDVRWLDLENGASSLTAADVDSIEAFLDQRDTRALLSALALTLLTPDSAVRTASINTIRSFFLNLVQQTHARVPNKWQSQRDALWIAVLRIYDEATPAGEELAVAALEYEDFLRTPLGRPRSDSQDASDNGRWVERLAELCADIDRVADGMEAARNLKSKIKNSPQPPIITYTNTTSTATFEDLYVPRTLVDEASGQNVDSGLLGRRGAPYRAVVRGAPGAGKSTFVQNLRREMAGESEGYPAVVLTVKNYFPSAQLQSIPAFLTSSLNATYNLELTERLLRDALTLGQAVVVFDGIDEIVDVHQRIEMVQRISTFATDYPATSILVTSRSVGYERAPLPSAIFSTLTLNEYTASQTETYVGNWFTFMGRVELVEEFFRESESVADLKKNPLLLSLLCILYRERGSIPRRRRDIYAQCADLLFHTWDSHRHVEQPEELHANGDRIMQELARWVFKSQAAQNGLPESVIKKTIGNYLRDAVGVEEGEARRRAGEFLEFCAGRAWLLGVIGNEYGERVFGFTHRTFFEYFAAEAIVRASADIENLAQTLVDAHATDETSVLPELLLQAVDEKLDRGAANTFKQACELTSDEMLILRLMEGVPLPAPTRAKGFERILEIWRAAQCIRRRSFLALLSLNVDARRHFERDFLASDRGHSAKMFLGAWANLSLQGDARHHVPVWGESIHSILESPPDCAGWWFNDGLRLWMWRQGHGDLPTQPYLWFVSSGAWGSCVGSLWLALELADSDVLGRDAEEIAQLFADVVRVAKRSKPALNYSTAMDYAVSALERTRWQGVPSGQNLSGDAFFAYVYATGIMHEILLRSAEIEELEQGLREDVRELWVSRTQLIDEYLSDSPREVRSEVNRPKWMREWALAKRSFTGVRWIEDPQDD